MPFLFLVTFEKFETFEEFEAFNLSNLSNLSNLLYFPPTHPRKEIGRAA